MTAASTLFLAGVVLALVAAWWWFVCWCTPGASEPMPPTKLGDLAPGLIDYRPSVLAALMQQGMTFADVATSTRRNAAFLTDTQRAELLPGASEEAARRAMKRMQARLQGSRVRGYRT